MGKLLRNDFSTLLKSKVLLGGSAILFFFLWLDGSASMYAQELLETVEKHGIPDAIKMFMELVTYRSLLVYFLMFLPSFVIGYDFDGGMIRNKIMAGFSRKQIYFSSLISSYVVSLFYGLILIVYNVIALINELTPVFIIEWAKNPEFFKIAIAALVFDLFIKFAICAVAVALMMMINQKAISIVAFFVLLLIGMLFGEQMRAYARDDREFLRFYDDHQDVVITRENPFYVAPDNPMKKVFISIDGINIFFSAMSEYGMGCESDYFLNDGAYYIGGLVDIAAFTGIGLYVFNKRNLK